MLFMLFMEFKGNLWGPYHPNFPNAMSHAKRQMKPWAKGFSLAMLRVWTDSNYKKIKEGYFNRNPCDWGFCVRAPSQIVQQVQVDHIDFLNWPKERCLKLTSVWAVSYITTLLNTVNKHFLPAIYLFYFFFHCDHTIRSLLNWTCLSLCQFVNFSVINKKNKKINRIV